jgi:hypothetical protein
MFPWRWRWGRKNCGSPLIPAATTWRELMLRGLEETEGEETEREETEGEETEGYGGSGEELNAETRRLRSN